MKKILTVISLFVLCFSASAQISYDGCTAVAGPSPYTLNLSGTTNDGGIIRNTYTSNPVPCSQGNCTYNITWDISNQRWELILVELNTVIHHNSAASIPNPPDLTLGTWVNFSSCTGITTLSGDVQSSVTLTSPEIDLIGGGNSILDGDVTPSTTDDTNFGNVESGNNDIHIFTIDNSAGTAALFVPSITISGSNAGDFSVGGISLPTSIAAGGMNTFSVTFTPSEVGIRNATITVNSDDANEAAYDYAVRGTGTTILPVELTSFNLEITKSGIIILRWSTALEINNEGFEIQHSRDGESWEMIDWITGVDNTFEVRNYSYNHEQPATGTNYYRLKQIDLNGEFEYSKVISIDASEKENTFRIAPNPASGSGTIALSFEESSTKTITIYNSLGAKVYQTIAEEDQSNIEINLPSLSQGIYIAELISGRSRTTKRMFIK